jgi:hypothetical protein
MTAVLRTAAVVPAPRPASEPVRRPRREQPRSEYWDVFEARWAGSRR